MNQEQPEVPPSTDALLEGFNSDVCKACALERRINGEDFPAVASPLPHTCEKATALMVGEKLEQWALAGQPGAPQGRPCAPPGTVLAR